MIGAYDSVFCAAEGSVILGGWGNSLEGCANVIIGGDNSSTFGTGTANSSLINTSGSYVDAGVSNTIIGGQSNFIGDGGSPTSCNLIINAENSLIGNGYSFVNIIGVNSITATRSNVLYTPTLIVSGQAVTEIYDNGNVGASFALDWENSNVQQATLVDSVTTYTQSNAIAGGVYSLLICQGASGGYNFDFTGAGILWPGGTPPTITGATGALDVVTLIYDGTNYIGNYNLNFS
jgi:hypothetical protein